jgi:hypothetical protein
MLAMALAPPQMVSNFDFERAISDHLHFFCPSDQLSRRTTSAILNDLDAPKMSRPPALLTSGAPTPPPKPLPRASLVQPRTTHLSRPTSSPFFSYTYELPLPAHRFSSPLFSLTSELLFSQTLCFHKFLRCPLLFLSTPLSELPALAWPAFKNTITNFLTVTCGLFGHLQRVNRFAIKHFRTIFAKYRGSGASAASLRTLRACLPQAGLSAILSPVFCLLFMLLLTSAPSARAWGCRGHQTVAALAETHLTPQAKAAVLALLTANPIDPQLKRYCGQTGLDPFVDSSTWADDERGREPATAPWHYIDIPLNVTQGAAQKFCGAGGCILQAITDQLAILKDKKAPGEKRAAALRFIIHFVGDLHQPLHGSTNSDRGGNCVPVKYLSRNPRSRNNSYVPNLHHVWDAEIPESQMQGADPFEFAETLDNAFQRSFEVWQQGGIQLDVWAWESHDHALETAYGAFGKPVGIEPDVPVNSCADDNNIGQRMLHKHLVIGEIYREQAGAVVEERLAQAGIRLAMILNEAAKGGL